MGEELIKVLEARDQRWNLRKKLVKERQSCLITITLCVPLAFRTDEEFWRIFLRLCVTFYKKLISSGHQADFEGCMQSDDGPAFFVSTKSEAIEIKKVCVEAEEVLIGGRLLDIDVMDSGGTPISRDDIDLPPRKCFMCEKPAALCVSRKVHSPNEISEYVMQLKKQIKSNSASKA